MLSQQQSGQNLARKADLRLGSTPAYPQPCAVHWSGSALGTTCLDVHRNHKKNSPKPKPYEFIGFVAMDVITS